MAKAIKGVVKVIGAVASVLAVIPSPIQPIAAIVAVGASVASAGLEMVAPNKPKPPQIAGSQTSFRLDPNAGIPYMIGRTFYAGNVVHRDTWGTDNEFHAMQIVWSGGGPIDAIEAFQVSRETVAFNGAGAAVGRYAGFMNLSTQLGTSPAAALASPVAGFPNYNGAMSGYAAGVWVTKFDKAGKQYAGGLPAAGIIGRGVKVYDPRLDSTYPGGSGPQRIGNEATWTYSQNPWLHGLAWALGRYQNGKRVIGVGMKPENISLASIVDAANVADANGWTIGGMVSSTDDKWEVLKNIAQAGGGQFVRLGASLTAFVNAPRIALATISESDLVGPGTVAATQGIRSRINRVVPQFRSEAHGWEVIPATPIEFAPYIAEDGGPRTTETDYALVQDVDQVATFGAYEILDARELGPIDLQLSIAWVGLEPGDAVNLDLPSLGLAGTKAIVLVRGVDPTTGSVSVSLRTETDAKHALALGKSTTVPASPSLVPRDLAAVRAPGGGVWTLAAVSAVGSNGEQFPILRVSGAIDNPTAEAIQIRYRPTGAAAWAMGPNVDPGAVSIEISGVQPGTAYEAEIAYRQFGVLGAWRNLGNVATGVLTASGFIDGGALAYEDAIYFNSPLFTESLGGAVATLANFRTNLGTSAAIAGQGALATLNGVTYGTGQVIGFGSLSGLNYVLLNDGSLRRADGVTTVTEAIVITSQGTAAGIAGQGALATKSFATWSVDVTGKPPIVSAQAVTADDTLSDPSVWNGGVPAARFLIDDQGVRFVRSTAAAPSQLSHAFEHATPVDKSATYEATWAFMEEGVGAPAAKFYTVVLLYDAAGALITGDGSFWFYPFAYQTLQSRNEYNVFTARFGAGTERPFPANAVRFGLGVLPNYDNTGGDVRVGPFFARKIESEALRTNTGDTWKANGLQQFGRTAVLRNGAYGQWGNGWFGKAKILGPCRIAAKPTSELATRYMAAMFGLATADTPTLYNAFSAIFYHEGVDGKNVQWLSPWNGGGSALGEFLNAPKQEWAIEYDGLFYRWFIDGIQVMSAFAGAGLSHRMAFDFAYFPEGYREVSFTPGKAASVIGTNTFKASDGSLVSQAALITSEGVAAALAGQGALATLNGVTYGTGQVIGFGELSGLSYVYLGDGRVRRSDGVTTLTEGLVITSVGTAAAIAGQGWGATASEAQASNVIVENGVKFVRAPAGGGANANGDVTGALHIRLPAFMNGPAGPVSMVRFKVDVYNYLQGSSVTYVISGYCYGAESVGRWYNMSAHLIGPHNRAYNVYFGSSNGRQAVQIGDATSTWNYPQVRVYDVEIGYSNVAAAWETDWQLAYTTAYLDNIQDGQGPFVPFAGESVFGFTVREDGSTVATLPNFKTLLGTAAAIAGQGDLATLNRASLPLGANGAVDSDFTKGVSYAWGQGASGTDGYPATAGMNLFDVYGGGYRNVAYSNQAGHVLTNGNYVEALFPKGTWGDLGAGSSSLAALKRYGVAVKPGDRVYARALAAVHRCTATVFILYFGNTGNFLAATASGGGAGYNGGGGNGGDPAGFTELAAIDTVGATGAAWMTMLVRMNGTGVADPYCFVTEPAFGRIAAGQTAIPAYTRGPPDPLSDQTAANVAAGFTGQAPAATDTTIEGGADVTSMVTGPTEVKFGATYDAPAGQYKAGQINPRHIYFTLWKNGVDVTASASWTLVSYGSGLTNASFEGAGDFNVIGLAGSATMVVAATLSGRIRYFTTKLTVDRDPAPVGGGGSGGGGTAGSGAEGTINCLTGGTSYNASGNSELSVTVGASGAVALSAFYNFNGTNQTGLRQAYSKWQRWNGSSWVDIQGEVLCSVGYYGGAGGDAGEGYNNYSDPGLTVGSVQKYRLACRGSNSANSYNFFGDCSAVTS